jgi:hypothetical protein
LTTTAIGSKSKMSSAANSPSKMRHESRTAHYFLRGISLPWRCPKLPNSPKPIDRHSLLVFMKVVQSACGRIRNASKSYLINFWVAVLKKLVKKIDDQPFNLPTRPIAR